MRPSAHSLMVSAPSIPSSLHSISRFDNATCNSRNNSNSTICDAINSKCNIMDTNSKATDDCSCLCNDTGIQKQQLSSQDSSTQTCRSSSDNCDSRYEGNNNSNSHSSTDFSGTSQQAKCSSHINEKRLPIIPVYSSTFRDNPTSSTPSTVRDKNKVEADINDDEDSSSSSTHSGHSSPTSSKSSSSVDSPSSALINDNCRRVVSESLITTSVAAGEGSSSIVGAGSDYEKYLAKHTSKIATPVLVGVQGAWYDVTSFRHRHPGGALLLEKCAGKDATELVKSFHMRDVLKGWRAVGRYDRSLLVDSDPSATVFRELHDQLERKGFFTPRLSFYVGKLILAFALLCCSILFVLYSPFVYYYDQQYSMVWHILAGILLGLSWQQCGFLVHDCMHNQLTHNRKIDQPLAVVLGSLIFGMSAHWWRDEHFEHHVFTNGFELDTKYVDPQMQEEVWVQSSLIFPLYLKEHPLLDWLMLQIIRIQHWLWAPMCVVAGRFAILVNAAFKEDRWVERVAVALHFCWMSLLLYQLPTNKHRLAYYGSAAIYQGVLHIQLLVSHYAEPWTDIKGLCSGEQDWYRAQITSTLNIKNPIWLDWFYGGLNFHIEHHLYPNMPRHNFREASVPIRRACESVGIHYNECGLLEAVRRCVHNLRNVSNKFELWSPARSQVVQQQRPSST